MSRPGVKVKGFHALMLKLLKMQKAIGRPALRKGVRAGTKVILKAVRSETPVDEGDLKKMMTSKIFGRGMRLGGIIGADAAKLIEAETQEGTGHRPSNLDWLVEYGHVTPEGTFVAPSGRMRAAGDAAMPQAEAAAIAAVVAELRKAT